MYRDKNVGKKLQKLEMEDQKQSKKDSDSLKRKSVYTNTKPPNETRFDKTKRKVYEIWFGGMSFALVSRNLIWRHENWFGNTSFGSP